MADRTPHEILGVARSATAEEITRAYRKLAMSAHPDRGGTADGFAALKAAYEYALALVGACETCNGSGVVEKEVELAPRKRRALMDGFAVRVPCPTCRKK